jgi:hypothetical protein
MIAIRIPRFSVALPALLALAALGAAALLAMVRIPQPATGSAEVAPGIVAPHAVDRLNELHLYRLSEWGAGAVPDLPTKTYVDVSQLPSAYVRSEKGIVNDRLAPRDWYADLMAVK